MPLARSSSRWALRASKSFEALSRSRRIFSAESCSFFIVSSLHCFFDLFHISSILIHQIFEGFLLFLKLAEFFSLFVSLAFGNGHSSLHRSQFLIFDVGLVKFVVPMYLSLIHI
eukprot:TRINITY_DN4289_c0_g1_i3.p1 TRINITY_DN4289_c0_g1~~TRINITY_DN4289_c0_g1_i3.p1  ORF type:complete len:114 (+),score=9.04 TRINITY_DN4289_c0_g1_i3:81-422(+)